MIRRLKKDVLEQLPDKVRSVVVLEIDKKATKKLQTQMGRIENDHKKFNDSNADHNDSDKKESTSVVDWGQNEHLTVDEQSGVDALRMLELRNSSLMACFRDTGLVKIPGIRDYIGDLFENGEKFLIFAHHRQVLDEIEAKVRELIGEHYIRIDGETKEKFRKEYVDKFQNNEACRIAVLSITAAGLGLTLTKATTVVFAELFWNPSTLLQCEDRAHRISQNEVVNVVYLIGKDTLDDKIFPMIHNKIQVISKTLSGKDIEMKVDSYKECLSNRAVSASASETDTPLKQTDKTSKKEFVQSSLDSFVVSTPETKKVLK
ncbi:helicase [Reticulomyxa filosa]|uniref:Helicase n=1 Tax=Reticulomyxa filosa TaxID=46433 RepID=X6LZ39_RETFI|nr:helicase [Reticulomyxa filosa]|eukprot:ETO06641.1 helicase [Reticulomyxa filosa]